jgi:hypothetical protein
MKAFWIRAASAKVATSSRSFLYPDMGLSENRRPFFYISQSLIMILWKWPENGYPLFLDRPMRQGDPQHLAVCSSMILSWYGFNVTLKRHLLHTTWTKTPDLPQRKVDTATAKSRYCYGQRCEPRCNVATLLLPHLLPLGKWSFMGSHWYQLFPKAHSWSKPEGISDCINPPPCKTSPPTPSSNPCTVIQRPCKSLASNAQRADVKKGVGQHAEMDNQTLWNGCQKI